MVQRAARPTTRLSGRTSVGLNLSVRRSLWAVSTTRERVAAAVGVSAYGLLVAVAIALPQRAPVVFLLMAAPAAIYLAYLARGLDPAWLLSAGIVLTVFSGNWGYIGFGSLPIKPDRLLFAIGLIALLIRRPSAGERPSLRSGWLHWLLWIVALYGVCSAFWVGTLHGSGLFGLLDKLGIVPFVGFTIAPLAFRTARQRNILLGALVALGLYLGLTAVFEIVGPKSLVFPSYIIDPSVGIHQGRARGPFVEAVADGLGLFACGVAAALALTIWRDRRGRILAGLTIVLCTIGIVLTLTRAVWLGAAVGAAVALAAAPRLRRYLLPTLLTAGVLVLGLLLVVPRLQAQAQTRANDQLPVWDRLNTDDAALRMLDARPLTGFGWSRFQADSRSYFRQASNRPLFQSTNVVHNVLLSNAVELGLPGATLWLLAVLGAIGGACLRRAPPGLERWRWGLVALAIQWAIAGSVGPLPYAFPNLLVWTWAGIVWGPQWIASARYAVRATERSLRGPRYSAETS